MQEERLVVGCAVKHVYLNCPGTRVGMLDRKQIRNAIMIEITDDKGHVGRSVGGADGGTGMQEKLRRWRRAEAHAAESASRVYPILLDQKIPAAQSNVCRSAIHCCKFRAKIEVTFVAIFLAGGIEPGIQVRIGNTF